jgi:hypothetical protein
MRSLSLLVMMGLLLVITGFAGETNRDRAVELAKAALRQSLGLAEDAEIEVRRAEPVDWPDASLGCPEEGRSYASVVTPGFQVVLQAARAIRSVHVGGGHAVVCKESMRAVPMARQEEPPVEELPPPIPEPTDPGRARLVRQAREDLAKRLSSPAEEILLVELSAVVWPDGSLGCPRPGVEYPQVEREGSLIRLRVGKKLYRYHSGGGRAPFLCETPKK